MLDLVLKNNFFLSYTCTAPSLYQWTDIKTVWHDLFQCGGYIPLLRLIGRIAFWNNLVAFATLCITLVSVCSSSVYCIHSFGSENSIKRKVITVRLQISYKILSKYHPPTLLYPISLSTNIPHRFSSSVISRLCSSPSVTIHSSYTKLPDLHDITVY